MSALTTKEILAAGDPAKDENKEEVALGVGGRRWRLQRWIR